MAYVRKKEGRRYQPYYQLVESCRVDGRPRQRVLVHLGDHPTVGAALKAWPKEINRLRRGAGRARDRVPAGGESEPYNRDLLRRADGMEKRAADLEEKLRRLRGYEERRP